MTQAADATFSGLPDPRKFTALMQGIPHFKDPYWHRTFSNPTFQSVANDLVAGASLVTDLDFTAYHHDAGFALLDAAVFTGLIHGEAKVRHGKLFADYAALPHDRELAQKIKDEFSFYDATLKLFAGIQRTALVNLARRLWFDGVPGFRERHPLVKYIYPEMAYLYALAAGNRARPGLVAVTASPDFAVEPALALLSLDRQTLRSWDLAVDPNGMVLAECPRPVHGSGKVSALQEVLPAWDYATGDNPRNDRAFLRQARKIAIGIGEEMEKLDGVALDDAGGQSAQLLTYLPLAKPPVAR
jgi:hypothetical protein